MRYEHRQKPTALWYYADVWLPPSGFPTVSLGGPSHKFLTVLCNRVDIGVHVRFDDRFSVRGWWIV